MLRPEHVVTYGQLLTYYDIDTCRRYEYYRKRHPTMTEAEACQAAIAWHINMKKQRQRRTKHKTGAN